MSVVEIKARAERILQSYAVKEHRLLINGKWIPAASGKTFDVIARAVDRDAPRRRLGGEGSRAPGGGCRPASAPS